MRTHTYALLYAARLFQVLFFDAILQQPGGSPLHNDRAPSGDMDGGRRAALEVPLLLAIFCCLEVTIFSGLFAGFACGGSIRFI